MENTNRNSNQTPAPVNRDRGVPVKPAQLINLTPHDIIITNENCRPLLTIRRSGVIARVRQSRKLTEVLIASERLDDVTTHLVQIPVVRTTYGEVEGLPEPQPNTYYIVSIIVAQALRGERDDLLYPDTGPGSVCRDQDGRIVGVRFLAKA